MRRRFTSRPAPAASVITAVIGAFMLIFGLALLTKAPHVSGGIFEAIMVVWIVGVIAVIIYHVMNAVRPGGVPTNIIETDETTCAPKTSAERLKELQELRDRKYISDDEYERKRQEILKQV